MSTRAERIENLATAFIECTTEWDFDQLPATVQAALRHAATTFVDWLEPEMVTEILAVGHQFDSGSLSPAPTIRHASDTPRPAERR